MVPTWAIAAGLTAVVMALVGGGCSDGSQAGSTPPSDADSGETSTEPMDEVTSDVPADPAGESSVEAASGPRLEHHSAVLRGPDGWRRGSSFGDLQLSADGGFGEFLTLFDQAVLTAEATYDEMGALTLKQWRDRDGRRFSDVELDGAPAYHVGGWASAGNWQDLVGTVHEGRYVEVVLATPRERAPAGVSDLLASFEWRD